MAKKSNVQAQADETKVDELVNTNEEAKVDEAQADENVKNDEAPKVEAPKVLKFSKKEFVKSRKFAKYKDLVNALLKEGKTYSIKEVETLINNFLYGKK